MRLRVDRQRADGASVLGQLFVDDVAFCLTLERADTLTPEGTYALTLTPSARCAQSWLWSPDDDASATRPAWAEAQHRLLLVNDVPGRDGIRIHAANKASELDGCTAVGQARLVDQLTFSRAALVALMNRVVPVLLAGSATIQYRPAQP